MKKHHDLKLAACQSKRRGWLTCLAMGALLASPWVALPASAASETPPTGDQVLRLVRMSQALQDLSRLKGRLRNNESGEQFPMELTMANNVIRFLLRNPNEIINLDLNNKGTKLSRVVSGGKVEMPSNLYSERVRGTDINYEDLSMRFLYWPNGKIMDEETVTHVKCWHVRVTNPDGRGPYGTVDIWVGKNSGAMMKMEAYDFQGHKVKQFMVRDGWPYKGAYILKKMRVETFDPATRDVKGVTYLEIDNPE